MTSDELKERFRAARTRMPENPEIDPVLDGDRIVFWLGKRATKRRILGMLGACTVMCAIGLGIAHAAYRVNHYAVAIPLILFSPFYEVGAKLVKELSGYFRSGNLRYRECFELDTCTGVLTVFAQDRTSTPVPVDEIAAFLYHSESGLGEAIQVDAVVAVTRGKLAYRLCVFDVHGLHNLMPVLTVLSFCTDRPLMSVTMPAGEAAFAPQLDKRRVPHCILDRDKLMGSARLVLDPGETKIVQPIAQG